VTNEPLKAWVIVVVIVVMVLLLIGTVALLGCVSSTALPPLWRSVLYDFGVSSWAFSKEPKKISWRKKKKK
jgi:hypothetical protein